MKGLPAAALQYFSLMLLLCSAFTFHPPCEGIILVGSSWR